MNKILSNVVMHKDYSKDIVRVLRSSKSDEVIRKKLSKYHENDKQSRRNGHISK